MPEYFFHIFVELFARPEHKSDRCLTPIDSSHSFRALKPFLRSSRLIGKRDSKLGTSRQTLKSKSPASPLTTPVTATADQTPQSLASDRRIDYIQFECADMESSAEGRHTKTEEGQKRNIDKRVGASVSGTQTKGRYVVVRKDLAGEEWGIVHLYRDASETPGLYMEGYSSQLDAEIRNGGNDVPVPKSRPMTPLPPAKDEDCTTLCILAVPSYFSPADFLAFVGGETREQVSHFRMIRTSRQNRYMVLMKFLDGKRARKWQADWNGKVFNSMEPETVHVVFLKSVEIVQTTQTQSGNTIDGHRDTDISHTSTFPTISNDPFSASSIPATAKPLAPRTPSLVELPTCPVCLERMDETTGLLTILCQHVFHCTCLQKWSGGGCPVCRYTHDDFSTRLGSSNSKSKAKHKTDGFPEDYELTTESFECETCHIDTSLWQCLICGKVGCGRYEGKHAYKHFQETGHVFSMDLETKRVWDYAGDVYVHRIIQDAVKPGEKLVELPGRRREPTALEDRDEDVEVAKMENIAVEYTHLLSSQLESQRVYFEEIVERAVDKASEASKTAERASEECEGMRSQIQKVIYERDEFQKKVLGLESECTRLDKRASKMEDMAKSVNARYLEEKALAGSMLERVKHLEETKLQQLEKKIKDLEEENATKDLLMEGLRDEHRDAMMQISAQEKLREMVARGELEPEDLVGATIEAGPARTARKKKSGVKKPDTSSHKPNATAATNTQKESGGSGDPFDRLARELLPDLGLNADGLQRNYTRDADTLAKLQEAFQSKVLNSGLSEAATAEQNPDEVESTKINGDGSGQVQSSISVPSSAASKEKRNKKNKGKGKK